MPGALGGEICSSHEGFDKIESVYISKASEISSLRILSGAGNVFAHTTTNMLRVTFDSSFNAMDILVSRSRRR